MTDFDVVGDDIETMGDLMGDDEMLGALASRAAMTRRPVLRLPPKPGWRRGAVAPGVWGPREGLEPLPLVPDLNGGIFTAAFPFITFIARPQRPFRPERLLVRIARSAGAGGVIVQSTGLFMGTQLMQAQRGNMDIEDFSATAFGVRMSSIPVGPGIEVAIPCVTLPAVPAGETVAVSIKWMGRTIQ